VRGHVDEQYMNTCHRGGDCLNANAVVVDRSAWWDYYDTNKKAYIYLECRLRQKYMSPTLLQIEEAEKYHSALATESYETSDLQLADQNGVWMTRSDDPECYRHRPFDEAKTCNICDLVCDIRDDQRYLNSDGTCPYSDVPSDLMYWKIQDGDQPCGDFLHPLLLENIESINRRRRKKAKAHLAKYLSQSRWIHALINSKTPIRQVWQRHYQPLQVYFRSFETIVLYLKNAPVHIQNNRQFLTHLRRNLEFSPSFKRLLRGENADQERGWLRKLDGYIATGRWSVPLSSTEE